MLWVNIYKYNKVCNNHNPRMHYCILLDFFQSFTYSYTFHVIEMILCGELYVNISFRTLLSSINVSLVTLCTLDWNSTRPVTILSC